MGFIFLFACNCFCEDSTRADLLQRPAALPHNLLRHGHGQTTLRLWYTGSRAYGASLRLMCRCCQGTRLVITSCPLSPCLALGVSMKGPRPRGARNSPVLPFLVFWGVFLVFPLRGILLFLSVFPFFSRDFKGSAGIRNPCFLVGGFPCLFPAKKEGQGH